MLRWRTTSFIFLGLFLLAGISLISYVAALYLFLGFSITWLVYAIRPLEILEISKRITSGISGRLLFVLQILLKIFCYLTSSFFILFLTLLFVPIGCNTTLKNSCVLSMDCIEIGGAEFSEFHIPLDYKAQIKPASLSMERFLIEEKITLNKTEIHSLLNQHFSSLLSQDDLNNIEQQIEEIKPAVSSREMHGKKLGWLVNELAILPLENLSVNTWLIEQLYSQRNIFSLVEKAIFSSNICRRSNCSEFAVEVADFPKNTFYQARKPIDFQESFYLNTESFSWSINNLNEEIKFAYIAPPCNGFKKIISFFLWFNSGENWVFTFLGASGTIVFLQKTGTVLYKIKPSINVQATAVSESNLESQAMSGDRHISINNGNYNESINTNGGNYVQGDYINMSQDLTQAAAQIQELIEQLQTRGLTVDIAQEQTASDIAKQAQTNPTVKDKLLKWGQSLGDATVSDVVKGAVKLAIRSAGIPLP